MMWRKSSSAVDLACVESVSIMSAIESKVVAFLVNPLDENDWIDVGCVPSHLSDQQTLKKIVDRYSEIHDTSYVLGVMVKRCQSQQLKAG